MTAGSTLRQTGQVDCRAKVVLGAIASCLLAAASGSAGATPGDAWERQSLGNGPADGDVAGGIVNGSRVVVHGGEGRLVSWVSTGGEFVATESPAGTSAPVRVLDLAQFGESTILVGSDSEHLVPRVWTSTDGSAWTEVATTGLDLPADLLSLSAAPDALYAAGLLREGPDPAAGMFVPAIWRSTDAKHWEAVTTPGPEGRGHVSDLAVAAGSVIVTLNVNNSGSIWRSTNGGATWAPAMVDVPSNAGWQIGSIARLGDRLVGVGVVVDDTGPAPLVVVSTDDGATWASSSEPMFTGEGGEGGGNVVAAAGAFWISAMESGDGFFDAEDCYRELLLCQSGGARPVLLRSTDGVEWVEIDLAPLSVSWIQSVLDVGDEGVMVVGRIVMSPRLETWTWASDNQPPRRPPPGEAAPDELPLVAHGDQITVGETYRFPPHVHCGMGLLGQFNDRWWTLVAGSTEWDPATDPSEPPPVNWPIAQEFVYGTITLVDPDTIEYTTPSGEVIAVYEASTTQPPLCA
jgi:hypothetical protein